eukprot:scaffold200267_cov31-Prasinocladus_malaysianus.AAC.1
MTFNQIKPIMRKDEAMAACWYLLEQAEEDVRVDGALVGLVQHDDAVRAHHVVQEALAEEHAVRHVLQDRLGGRAVLETDRIPHL